MIFDEMSCDGSANSLFMLQMCPTIRTFLTSVMTSSGLKHGNSSVLKSALAEATFLPSEVGLDCMLSKECDGNVFSLIK